MRSVAAACLALCGALVLAGCGGGSKGRDDLVFVSTRDGAYELYAMNADGSHQHRLTSDHGGVSAPSKLYYQLDPAWSPNGRLIAFASQRDGPSHLFVVGVDGKHTRRLTSGAGPDRHPTWSPDGRRIAFVRGNTGALEVMNANGTGVHRITRPADAAVGDPAWSPDGRWIACDLRVPGDTTGEIWLVHPDGSDAHALTSLGANSISPAWSPNGRTIAFSSDKGRATLAIYEIGVSGKGLRLVAETSADAVDPTWSPDGKEIAFSTNGAVDIVDATGAVDQLTNPKDNDSEPVWNPTPAPVKGS